MIMGHDARSVVYTTYFSDKPYCYLGNFSFHPSGVLRCGEDTAYLAVYTVVFGTKLSRSPEVILPLRQERKDKTVKPRTF